MTNEIKLNLSAAGVQELKRAMDMGLGLQIGLQLGVNVTVSAAGTPNTITTSNSDLSATKSLSYVLDGTVAGETTIDWGDGTVVTSPADGAWNPTHTMPSSGTFEQTITGPMTKFQMQGATFTSCVSIGDSHGLTGLQSAFNNRFSNNPQLQSVPADIPATITNFNQCFRESALSGDLDVSAWRPATGANLFEMFNRDTNIDPILGAWVMDSAMNTTFVMGEDVNGRRAAFTGRGLGDVLWNDLSAASVSQFLISPTITTANYDAFLIQFDATSTITTGTLTTPATYTAGGAAEAARSSIIAKGVTISDGGAA